MIDNPRQVERLLFKLRDSLPLVAVPTAPLRAIVRDQVPGTDIPPQLPVTRIDYAGDEGGIVCHLKLGEEAGSNMLVVSITHLAFNRALPLAREIAAYQKHRIKRLRRS